MRTRSLIKGLLTFVPGMERVLPKRDAGHSPPASYFYGVWLKHLAILNEQGVHGLPQSVAELGPGDTLGVGLAALLCGAQRYYALDIVPHTDLQANSKVLGEVLELLQKRAPRPTKGWPDFDHLLDERLFPSDLLTEDHLSVSLAPERIARIGQALQHGEDGGIRIAYRAPWTDAAIVEEDSVDLVISQAVLEHVVDVEGTYRALYKWLKPGGIMSHQIDFTSHRLSREWNGYRAISEPVWKAMMGKRSYMINRVPCSAHLRMMSEAGFELVCVMKHHRTDGISRSRLAQRWQDISDDDLACSEVFVQARKPTHRPDNGTSQPLP